MTSHETIPPSAKADANYPSDAQPDAALEVKFERRMTAITASVDTYQHYAAPKEPKGQTI